MIFFFEKKRLIILEFEFNFFLISQNELCPYCGKTYRNKPSLYKHMQSRCGTSKIKPDDPKVAQQVSRHNMFCFPILKNSNTVY